MCLTAAYNYVYMKIYYFMLSLTTIFSFASLTQLSLPVVYCSSGCHAVFWQLFLVCSLYQAFFRE